MRDVTSIQAEPEAGEGTLGRWILAALTVASGCAIGFITAQGSFMVLAVCLGGVLLPLLVNARPMTGFWMLLGATSLFSFYGSLPFTSIQSIHLPDLMLAFLYFVCFARMLKRRMVFKPNPLVLPFVLVCASAALSLGAALMRGAVFFEALREIKLYAYYAVFLLVPSVVRDPASLRLFMGGCILMGLVSALNLVVGGLLHPPDLSASEEAIYYGFSGVAGEGGGAVLIFWSVCCLAALLLIDRVRLLYLGSMAVLLLYYVFKFHRHMYLMIAFSFGLIGLLAFSRYRVRVLKVAGVGVVCLLAGAAAIAWGPASARRTAELSIKRLASLHGIENTSTVTIRLLENHYAWKTIKANPLTGIGFATRYRPDIYGPDDRLFTFVHNGYLGILVKVGVIGFGLFLWFGGLYLKRALAQWPRGADPVQKAVVLGSAVAFAGMALANLTSPYFMQDWGVCAFGLMVGVGEAIRAMNAPVREAPA